MARHAMTQPAITNLVSSYKSLKKPIGKITCNMFSKLTKKFVLSRKNTKYVEYTTCKQC